MWDKTMKIVRNTLLLAVRKKKERLRTIFIGHNINGTQEGQLLRSITLNSHGKNKWL